ncbi:MAG TPA: hypothetical protein PKA59_10710 [Chakrabartia sp.]|nr:hypothetical protein [Chakrabartia sp.]
MRALLLLPLLALAACGSNEKEITIKDGEGGEQTVTVGKDDGTTTIKSEDGTAVVRTGAEGANFPPEAPQYPGSTVTASANFAGKDGGSGLMATQETGDEPAKVLAFYKDKLAAAGRKIAMETNTGEGSMLIVEGAEGGKGEGMMIAVNKDAGKTIVTITGGKGGQ